MKIHLIILLLCFQAFFLGMSWPVDAKQHQRMLVDQAGRTVAVPDIPKRVVSMAPNVTEIIYALGRQDCLKGVTAYSNYPEQARYLPRVGSYIYLDIEKIVSLYPDLCIAVKDGNPKGTVQRLEALGIPVYAVNPRGIESVMVAITDIGRLLNSPRAAETLVMRMRSRIAHVRGMVAGVRHRPRVFFQIGISPIVSVGSDTLANELITVAGGVNIAGGLSAYPRFSIEDVLASSPEVIVISSMARGRAFERVKAQWEQWPQIPAVKHNRIYLVDSDLFDRPSPRLVDGLDMLVRLIHPELFNK